MRPRPILTLAETRAAEAGSGLSDAELMEHAGATVAEAARRFGGGAPVLILCGPGNNGGDGYVAARLLAERGAAVRVAALRPPRAPAAVGAAQRWSGPVETLAQAVSAPVVVDALFGTGLSRPLENEPAASLARLVAAAKFSLAVDMPSGVSTENGRLLGDPPRFDLTLALGALKPAHCLLPAAERCGRVLVGDIGLALPTESQLVEIAPPCLALPGHGSDKYKRGKLLVVGGAMPGAGLMAATAGQRAGAGYVELLAGEGGSAPHSLVRRDWSQAAVSDKRIAAIAIGPGLGLDDQARDRLSAVLASAKPVVLDADALTLIGRTGHERLRGHVVTPHWGEFVRLFGDTGEGRLAQARAAAGASGAVVLLKGSDTIVAHPDGRAAVNPLAPAWLASAGTGDVLTGIIGGLLAQGFDPFLAAQAGAWLHGEAARAAGPFLIADDLIAALPAVMARCL